MTAKQEKIKEYMALCGAECYRDKKGKIWRKTEKTTRWMDGAICYWFECVNSERINEGDYLCGLELDEMEFLGSYGEYLLRRKIERLEQKQQ